MKKKFTVLIAAAMMLLTMMAQPITAWGQTRAEVVAYTLDGTIAGTGSNYSTGNSVTQNEISWIVTGNTTMNPWRIGGKSISNVDRPVYSTNSISDNITKIEVEHGTASGITVNSWTVIVASDANFSNVVSTLTPTFTASATTTINRPTGADWTNCYYKFVYNVTVTQTSNKFLQFIKADFYKQEGSGPTIATPTFTPAGGEYITAQNVTVSCETQGATIYYTTDGGTPDNTSTQYTAAIPVSTTTTIKAIAYVGTDASSVATATYTIVQPLSTMQAIFDKATEVGSTATYAYITLGNWVVSGVSTNGKNVFVTDGTKGFVIFDNGGSMGFTAGDILSGTVYCKVQLYNGFAELTLLNATTSGISVTTGGTVTAANIAMADLAGVNTGALVHYDNLTCSIDNNKYYLSDGTTFIQVYNAIFAFGSTLVADHVYNITGVYQQFNTTLEVLPRSADDIEEVVSGPVIDAANVNIAADAVEGSISYSISNPVTGGVLTAATTAGWLTLDNDFTSPIAFDCSANTTISPRTATVTLTYTYNRSTVTKDVTVTQAGYEAPHYTWDLSTNSYDPNPTEDLVTWSSAYATMTNAKGTGTNANNYLGGDANNRTSTRFYGGNILTITPAAGYAITSMVFTPANANENYINALVNSNWTNASAAVNGTTVVVTPTNGTEVMSAVINATCGWTAVTVYYVSDNTPSIVANNISLDYDATSGQIAYTVNNAGTGGSMSASTTAGWLTLEDDFTSPIDFTCSANTTATERSATVTLTYTYGSGTITKDVTVTQAAAPVVYSTIPALFAAATGTETNVLVTFNDWVVSGVSTNGKNVFVTDNNGNGFVIFNSGGGLGNTYSVGDILSGDAVSCNLVLFNGFAELTNVNATDLTITSGGTVSTANITLANLSGVNTGALVHYDGLTCSVNNNKYYLSDGTTTLQVYNSIYDFGSLEDGKTYNITGIYQQFNETKEILPRNAADIEEVVVATPTITVASNAVNVSADGGDGVITVTYENITTIVAEVVFCDITGASVAAGYYDWIDAEINTDNNVYYVVDGNDGVARTAYLKVHALDDDTNDVYSDIVTISQDAYVAPPTPGNWVLTNLADLTATDIFVIVGDNGDTYAMSNDNGTSSAPAAVAVTVASGTLSGEIAANIQWNLGISADGYLFYPNGNTEAWLYCTNTNDGVRVGTGNAKHFTLDATSGYLTTTETTDQRYLGIYNSQDWRCYKNTTGNTANQTFTFYKKVSGPVPPSITLSTYSIDATSAETQGEITVTYNNIATTAGVEIRWYESDGTTAATEPSWMSADINGGSLNVDYLIDANTGAARSAYFRVYGLDNSANGVYSNLVTVEQAAFEPPFTGTTFTLATAIESGRRYIITNGSDKAMGGQTNNNRAAVDITTVSGVAQVSSSDVVEFVINGPDANGFYTIYDAGVPGYLYGAGANSSNHLKTEEFCDNRGQWTISFDATTGSALIEANFTGRNTMRYNSGSDIFSCYAATGQADVYLYLKDEVTPSYAFYKDITGYSDPNTPSGYYLIASPADVDPATVNGMIDATPGNYDLYYFDQSQVGAEWRNYKQGAFNLVPGKGYLYAHNTTITLNFTGTPYNGNGVIALDYDNNATFKGLNLVGNPFGTAATSSKAFYIMNDAGNDYISHGAGDPVDPMQGIIVFAAGEGETQTFAPGSATTKSGITIDLSKMTGNREDNLVDRAIVRFDESGNLPKYQLNPNHTKVYIPQDGNDFAVVSVNAVSEIPVSFKAQTDGAYNLNFASENLEFDALYLVDDLTGETADLLANPNYHFEATTTDNANRFRLMFSATNLNENSSEASFAFINGDGNIVITDMDNNSTVQLIDVTGRVIVAYRDNARTISTDGMTPGVYVLRLIQNGVVRNQKLVIK